MHGADVVGPREVQQVVVAADGAVPVPEALAAVAGFVELQRLDERPHGAVEDQDALGGGRAQGRADLVAAGEGFRFSCGFRHPRTLEQANTRQQVIVRRGI